MRQAPDARNSKPLGCLRPGDLPGRSIGRSKKPVVLRLRQSDNKKLLLGLFFAGGEEVMAQTAWLAGQTADDQHFSRRQCRGDGHFVECSLRAA